MNDGSVRNSVHFPSSSEYNNEKNCNEIGRRLVEQEQLQIGTNAGKVYFICENFTEDDIKKATQKPGQDVL